MKGTKTLTLDKSAVMEAPHPFYKRQKDWIYHRAEGKNNTGTFIMSVSQINDSLNCIWLKQMHDLNEWFPDIEKQD